MRLLIFWYIEVYVLRYIFMIFKIIFLAVFHFLRIFEEKNRIFLKSMTKIAPFPQPNFAKWLRFLTIFWKSWPPGTSRKIAESMKYCFRWSVETVLFLVIWVILVVDKQKNTWRGPNQLWHGNIMGKIILGEKIKEFLSSGAEIWLFKREKFGQFNIE